MHRLGQVWLVEGIRIPRLSSFVFLDVYDGSLCLNSALDLQ